jgi:hypothetical protein
VGGGIRQKEWYRGELLRLFAVRFGAQKGEEVFFYIPKKREKE